MTTNIKHIDHYSRLWQAGWTRFRRDGVVGRITTDVRLSRLWSRFTTPSHSEFPPPVFSRRWR